MGVHKLWELLLTIAQPMSVEQLEGKVLAIDASIWIVKIDSLYSSSAEKLKSILSKIMLLKRNNILPLFVFDGTPPALKRRTLEDRYRKRLVAGEQEARKKSELEVMRMVESGEVKARLSERVRRSQEELSEVNHRLSILSELQEKADQEVGSEILEKIALQSEILNTKYRIMLDLAPALADYKFFISPEEYEALDLDRKTEYLEELEEHKWRIAKAARVERASLSQEEKLMLDLQAIEKRSIVREMQDELFRKMLQKNVVIKDGYQIIETIYNGRKVIQKRKVREQGSNNLGLQLRKGKMKNNAACLNFQQENLSGDEQPDDFLAEFCSSTVSRPKHTHQPSENSSQAFSNTARSKPQKNQKNKAVRADKKEESDESEVYLPFKDYQGREHEEQPERYVNQEQLEEAKAEKGASEEQFENRDKLPVFISNPVLQMNLSGDNLELQGLLKVLGIPFLVAPGEAEAQCAALEMQGIVDGVVTEDSDAFLFGAKHVFRGVFHGGVRYYDWRKIEQRLRMTREKLIIFAMLLGSDYTGGVKGVGLVNAMEILKVFGSLDRLEGFKRWARLPDVLLPSEETTGELLKSASPEEIEFYQLHRKFKNHWYVDEDFGNARIQQAYLAPDVLPSAALLAMQREGAFQSKPCDAATLERLLNEKLEFEEREHAHFMKVLSLEYKSKRENTLHNYFPRADDSQQLARIRSKRLERSLMGECKEREGREGSECREGRE